MNDLRVLVLVLAWLALIVAGPSFLVLGFFLVASEGKLRGDDLLLDPCFAFRCQKNCHDFFPMLVSISRSSRHYPWTGLDWRERESLKLIASFVHSTDSVLESIMEFMIY